MLPREPSEVDESLRERLWCRLCLTDTILKLSVAYNASLVWSLKPSMYTRKKGARSAQKTSRLDRVDLNSDLTPPLSTVLP